MNLTAKRKEQISSVLIICLGNILNAFSARVFLLPADLVAGGTTRNRTDPATHNRDPTFLAGTRF